MKQLILGGARSGKSSLAEHLAQQIGKTVVYIATTDVHFNDQAMTERIEHHRLRRPDTWLTVESPRELAAAIHQHASPQTCLLIDCLTLWVTNCLLAEESPAPQSNVWETEKQAFLDALKNCTTDLIIVSNEVGWGIVPMGELSRRFVDETGFLHQASARLCDRVILTAAGLPLVLKGDPL